MSVTAEQVVVDLIARTDKLERDIRSARAQFSTETEKIQRASAAMRQQLEKDSAATGATFKRMAGALAGYFSGREVLNLVNTFTQFQNSLRVAGVASEDLGRVQDRLFKTAQKYGIEIGTLGQLYGSLTNASKELGASQEQIFRLTDVVSASLKISGQSAAQAGGALLQLGQVLRGDKVQMADFGSLIDGMYPLLEAAAAGSDRWKGSVGDLITDVRAGKVASQELFAAILNGSENVIKRAELSTLSLASAFTQLRNALTIYVGEAAQSSGAQAALAAGIGKIAENLGTLIPALAVVGAALGVKYVISAGAAALASVRAEAALLGLTTRAEVAGFAIGSLARSLAINGALLAVTAAVADLAGEIASTDALVKQANTQYDEMKRRLEAAGEGAKVAGDGSRGVGDGAAAAEPKVRSFAGAVGELANQLYRQAKAARAARIEMLETRLKDSQTAEVELGGRTKSGRDAGVANLRPGGLFNLRNWPVIRRNAAGDINNWWTEGKSDQDLDEAFKRQISISQNYQRQLKEERAKPLADYIPTAGAGGSNGGGSSSKRTGRAGGGGSGGAPTAEQIREQQERNAAEIAAAQLGYLQELAASTQNAAERAKLEQDVIEAMRKAAERDLINNEKLSAADRAQLIELNTQTAELRKRQVVDREADRLRVEQLALSQQSLRDEDALLQRQASLADTQEERRQIELRRVDLAYQLERGQIREEIAQAELAKDVERLAAARKRLADLDASRPLADEEARRATDTPLERYRRELNDPKTAVQEAVVQKLQSVNDGITDAISDFIGVDDPFLKQLISILIEQVLMKPIADALAQAGQGGGGIGGFIGTLASGIGAIFGGGGSTTHHVVPGFASGGSFPVGGTGGRDRNILSINGVPRAAVSANERINVIPANTRAAASSGARISLNQTINIDASGSVNPDGYSDHLRAYVRRDTVAIVAEAQRQTLRAVPSRMRQYDTDGT